MRANDGKLNLVNGYPVDAIYLDFAKAFDTVPHRRLLLKLEKYGVTGELMKWIQAFVCGRTQRVVLKGLMSSWKQVLSGVPQGFVLGPLLFVVYINDLQDVLSVLSKIYADDNCLIVSLIIIVA